MISSSYSYILYSCYLTAPDLLLPESITLTTLLLQDESMNDQQQLQLLWLQLEQQQYEISRAVSQTEILRQQVAIESQSRSDAEVSSTSKLGLYSSSS